MRLRNPLHTDAGDVVNGDPVPSLEEKLNVLTHAAGAVIALLGVIFFLVLDPPRSMVLRAGAAVYGATLVLLYCASALYHGAVESRRRALLRRLDHAAIYLLIAGTYTPVLLVAVGGRLGTGLLCTIWALALCGILLVIFAMGRFPKVSLALYLGMGWLCLWVLRRLIAGMPSTAFLLLLAGGAAYTVGVIFYVLRRPYCHAIWHLFVLAGSILQFFAVTCLA